MGRLRQRDFEVLLDAVRQVEAANDLAAFPRVALSAVFSLIPCAWASYNDLDLAGGRWAITRRPDEPALGALEPALRRAFRRFEHPLVAHFARTRNRGACRISDLLTLRQFHRLDLYQGYFHPLGIERQLAFPLRASRGHVIGIALSRRSRDFSERDRLVCDLFRPHLLHAHRNAAARTHMRQALATFEQALEESGRAVILVDARGRVALETPGARRLLATYFGAPARRARRLPGQLERWRQALRRRDSDERRQAPVEPLLIGRDGAWLAAHMIRRADGEDGEALLLDERRLPSAASLASLELTAREREILGLVARGETDKEIAQALFVSPRTVEKHLEHVYDKLGVHTRTAAAVLAFRAAGLASRPP